MNYLNTLTRNQKLLLGTLLVVLPVITFVTVFAVVKLSQKPAENTQTPQAQIPTPQPVEQTPEEVEEEPELPEGWKLSQNSEAGIEFIYPNAKFTEVKGDYFTSLYTTSGNQQVLSVTTDKVTLSPEFVARRPQYQSTTINDLGSVTIQGISTGVEVWSAQQTIQTENDPCSKTERHDSYIISTIPTHDINVSQYTAVYSECGAPSIIKLSAADFVDIQTILDSLELIETVDPTLTATLTNYQSPLGYMQFSYDAGALGAITSKDIPAQCGGNRAPEGIQFAAPKIWIEINDGCGRGGGSLTALLVERSEVTGADGRIYDVVATSDWTDLARTGLNVVIKNSGMSLLQLFTGEDALRPELGSSLLFFNLHVKAILQSMVITF